MFVPINVDVDKYKKGDIVVNIEDVRIPYGVFTVGHEFTVLEYDRYGTYTLIDHELNILTKRVQCTKISLKTDYKKAKIIRDNRMDRINFKKFILNNCPNKREEIDDRDYYDACNLIKGYGYRPCKCKDVCIKYIDNDKIKNNKFIVTYLRKLKLKKLKKISD